LKPLYVRVDIIITPVVIYCWLYIIKTDEIKIVVKLGKKGRGELSYLAPLGSENISAPYFKQCFFRGGVLSPRLTQMPRLPVPRQK